MTARRLYARIIVGSLKGMAVGFGIGLVIGPFTGYLMMSLAYALADEPPDPNGSPGLAAAPFIFAFWGGIIGAILLGAIRGVQIWLAADSPAAAARHRETMGRAVIFAIPAMIGVVAGFFWGSFAHEQAIESMRPTQPQLGGSRRMLSDVAGIRALGAFLLFAVPGVYVGLLALRRRRSHSLASEGGP